MIDKPYIILEGGINGHLIGFSSPIRVLMAWQADQVLPLLREMQEIQKSGKWLAGYVSYELGYVLEPKLNNLLPEKRKIPLLCFGVFDAPNSKLLVDFQHHAQREKNKVELTPPQPQWDQIRYTKAFDQVREYIKAGDFYQVNLTFPMQSQFSGDVSGLYARLCDVQKVPHGGIMDFGDGLVILSRSPELFFSIDKERTIKTRPMKGTQPRGATAYADKVNKEFLASDSKNRAENLMIVDLLRNDISRVAKLGSVYVPQLFTIETYKTVHQMTSLVEAKLRPDVSIYDIFKSLFPCGSITGAPKIRAMEVIYDLEQTARDIYCGSMGWIAPSGEMSFNVCIRTLSLFDNGAVYFNVGGGIVYDSTAQAEYQEALWKTRFAMLN